MARINVKKKGNAYELATAKYLTKITGAVFHRVPMSGAFSSVNYTTKNQFKGDVFTEDKRYEDVTIECKAHKELNFSDLFNSKSKFFDWIKQSQTESQNGKWILFFKINSRGKYYAVDKENQLSSIIDNDNADSNVITVNNNIIIKKLKQGC